MVSFGGVAAHQPAAVGPVTERLSSSLMFCAIFDRQGPFIRQLPGWGRGAEGPKTGFPLDPPRRPRLSPPPHLENLPTMAGHSQFKNIMFRKGKQDKERSKLFAKLGREITVASKSGMPDPKLNPRLRNAIIAAKAESMPKDNIERAIKKGQGGD